MIIKENMQRLGAKHCNMVHKNVYIYINMYIYIYKYVYIYI